MENTLSETQKPQTLTNWYAFVKARLVPAEIICDGYRAAFARDMSCHTRLPRDVDTMLRHIDPHGGGFLLKLKTSEKEWEGWTKLADMGIEVQDFRCDVCDEVLPLASQRILFHMKSHKGKTRRVIPGGTFNIWIGTQRPISADDADDL